MLPFSSLCLFVCLAALRNVNTSVHTAVKQGHMCRDNRLSYQGLYKLDVVVKRLKIELWSDNGLKFMIINTQRSGHTFNPLVISHHGHVKMKKVMTAEFYLLLIERWINNFPLCCSVCVCCVWHDYSSDFVALRPSLIWFHFKTYDVYFIYT